MVMLIFFIGLFLDNSAQAGATHGWCMNDKLPSVQVCEDQRGSYIRVSSGSLLEFKFKSYGSDRSVVYFSENESGYTLMTTDWGAHKYLIDSSGDLHSLQCGYHQHGLCPTND
ncbi:MAG: hypothetical protein M9962_12610 [Oligoflexia bacterium]|nr:hypothetical protein [Oligoflexia bacterium]